MRPADAFGILFGDDKIVVERPEEFDGLHDEGMFAGARCGSLQSLYVSYPHLKVGGLRLVVFPLCFCRR